MLVWGRACNRRCLWGTLALFAFVLSFPEEQNGTCMLADWTFVYVIRTPAKIHNFIKATARTQHVHDNFIWLVCM